MRALNQEVVEFLGGLPPARARIALAAILAADGANVPAQEETLEEFTKRAQAAFEKDMQPVCSALASALHGNDLAALKGLQALLPGLLREVNRAPALADLLAYQMGKAVLDGMQEGAQ